MGGREGGGEERKRKKTKWKGRKIEYIPLIKKKTTISLVHDKASKSPSKSQKENKNNGGYITKTQAVRTYQELEQS